MKIKKILAALASLAMLAVSFTACSSDKDKSSSGAADELQSETESENESGSESDTASEEDEDSGESSEKAEESGDMTIKWLADYDLNPTDGGERSIALTLFEDAYGGKVEWIPTTNDTKYDDYSKMILGGEKVDMIPYELYSIPKGASEELYQPMDELIDLDSELWSGMKETADKLQYKGKHYAVPYRIDDPICIIYSRKMIKDEELDDPYELYKQGKWDWDSFTSMMEKFTENSGEDTRWGCTGWIGQALVQSTGKTMVNYDGTKFTNNLSDPDIEKAEQLLEKLASSGLYNDSWHTYFPESGSTLFYAMAPWALEESNAFNSDEDIFIVPFPKMPGADKYYSTCSFGAKMLAAGSDKGNAVAKYIECERLAVTDEKYIAISKENALTPVLDYQGEKIRFLTEEQWNVIQEITDPSKVVPMFDYGFGMGSKMGGDSVEYDSRGAMKNLTDGLIGGMSGSPDNWEELRDSYTKTIDEEIAKFN